MYARYWYLSRQCSNRENDTISWPDIAIRKSDQCRNFSFISNNASSTILVFQPCSSLLLFLFAALLLELLKLLL
jgi:hypothetical protein